MESDASHLRNLIERAREYDEVLIKQYGTDLLFEAGIERLEMNKAADKAEEFLNRPPEPTIYDEINEDNLEEALLQTVRDQKLEED